MAPVIVHLAADVEHFEVAACVTAQHRRMLDQVIDVFDLRPEFDLNLMQFDQTLYDITSGVLIEMRDVYRSYRPDVALVHGDTTTTMSAALAAFYEKIPVGHIEAGLRTGNVLSPWPEEMNRKIATAICSLHFAPTAGNRQNLLREGVADDRIFVTGNTVVDALIHTVNKIRNESVLRRKLAERFDFLDETKRLLLVTAHRRENFGIGIDNICAAIREIATDAGDVEILYPVHPNPRVCEPVHQILGELPNIHLVEPLDYLAFTYVLDRSFLVLTDSGGIQEEAPTLGKPVLVMRDTSERPEAIASGAALLVGTNTRRIVEETKRLLTSDSAYQQIARVGNPYGDGKAAERIAYALKAENVL